MWTLQSHKVDLKSYNYWQFSTDCRLANMSASHLCLSFDSLAASRFLEELQSIFSKKKEERNCSNVLSSQVTGHSLSAVHLYDLHHINFTSLDYVEFLRNIKLQLSVFTCSRTSVCTNEINITLDGCISKCPIETMLLFNNYSPQALSTYWWIFTKMKSR